eukprot:3004470-Rhodomonas_salina.8
MRQGRLWEERPFGEPASEKMTWRGGVMQVQNTGSTFFFVLPLRQPKKDNAGGAAGGSKAEPGGSGEQELVKEYSRSPLILSDRRERPGCGRDTDRACAGTREAHLASVSDAQTKAGSHLGCCSARLLCAFSVADTACGARDPEDLASVTRGDSPTNAVAAKRAMHHSDLYDSFEILSVDDNLVNHIVVRPGECGGVVCEERCRVETMFGQTNGRMPWAAQGPNGLSDV